MCELSCPCLTAWGRHCNKSPEDGNVLRRVHARFGWKPAHWCFLCVFSHDKQETEEVVQLQEGGRLLLIIPTAVIFTKSSRCGSRIHLCCIFPPAECFAGESIMAETTPSNLFVGFWRKYMQLSAARCTFFGFCVCRVLSVLWVCCRRFGGNRRTDGSDRRCPPGCVR